MPRTRATGWTVTLTHPTSGRTIRPDVLDEPQFTPSLNSLPEVRVPVRRAPAWLRQEFDDNPDMAVYLDGQELPIDQLRDVEQRQDRTILIGEGGVELKNRVQAEYRSETRPQAVRDLVSNNTGYATDVDDTDAETQEGVTVQDPSGESELGGVLSPAADVPLIFTSGGVKPTQTSFVTEAENYDRATTPGTGTGGDYSNDGFVSVGTAVGQRYEWDFTTEHVIPADDFAVRLRFESTDSADVTWYLDGEQISTYGPSTGGALDWGGEIIDISGTPPSSDLSVGGHTLAVEVNSDTGGALTVDLVQRYDTGDRFGGFSYTYDNTLNTPGGYLDGPEDYPASVDAEFDEYTSAFSITGGDVTATINDTSNNQALALSNDFGSTYPISGSNTTNVGGDFASPGSALNLKATLSRYSPSGAQSATPRFGYDAQRLDAYTIQADISFEALLIDDRFDNNLRDVLNDIARDQYIWSYQIQNGTPTLAWTEREQRTADRDPELEDAQITKQGETWDSVTIKASNVPVTNEQFTASTSFVNLAESALQTGSESVYDPGAAGQFERGTDYEMDYSNGEIRILSGGGMTASDTYQIDYRHEVQGTHDVVSNPTRELVETVPGIVSARQAEQIAYVIAEVEPEVNTPRYEGQLIVPSVDATFDPLEALELDSLDLPDVATPLSIGGQPEVTPRGLVFNVGSAPPLESQLSGIRDRVQKVSDRV